MKQLADEENLPFTCQDNEALRGVPRRRSHELSLKGRVFPEAKLVEMETRKNNYYQALLENVTPDDLLPGSSVFCRRPAQPEYAWGLVRQVKTFLKLEAVQGQMYPPHQAARTAHFDYLY